MRLCATMRANLFHDLFNTFVIHISHDDLDGIGCTAALAVFANRKHANLNVTTINTSKLGDEVYNTIRMVYNQLRTVYTTKRCTILITDLGGINLDTLIQEYESEQVTFYIVDHHRSQYVDDRRVPKYGDIEVMATSEKGVIIHDTTVVEKLILWMYIDYSASATALFYQLLDLDDCDGVNNFCQLVSAYDSGNFGKWLINSSTIKITEIPDNVSTQVLLNSTWNACRDNPWVFIRGVVNLIKSAPITPGLLAETFETTIMDRVIETILRMEHEYSIWCDMMYAPTILEERTINLTPYWKMKLPKDINFDTRCIKVVQDTDQLNDYNFSLFSKYYLDNNTRTCGLIIRVPRSTDQLKVAGLRSCDRPDPINCYEIAKLNGGGGHPCAAGFPLVTDTELPKF